jgi:alkylhydroperoxidase family enzyme
MWIRLYGNISRILRCVERWRESAFLQGMRRFELIYGRELEIYKQEHRGTRRF